MVDGARTPEELETLLEDAFVTRDVRELRALFDASAVLAPVRGGTEARGDQAIGRAVVELWARDGLYVAGESRVLQAREIALVAGDAGIHVVRRGGDGSWRVVIALLDLGNANAEEET